MSAVGVPGAEGTGLGGSVVLALALVLVLRVLRVKLGAGLSGGVGEAVAVSLRRETQAKVWPTRRRQSGVGSRRCRRWRHRSVSPRQALHVALQEGMMLA